MANVVSSTSFLTWLWTVREIHLYS